jgi:hypothetical protein
MPIADCGMQIVKGYKSEIRNPKSENWMGDASGVPLGAGPFHPFACRVFIKHSLDLFRGDSKIIEIPIA